MLARRYRLLAVFFCAAIASPALAASGAIAGKIVDNGVPVGGAKVTARALSSEIETTRFSCGDGTYAFDRLMPGSYEIEVKVPGKTAASRPRLIEDLSVAHADFQLLPDPDYTRSVPSAHWLSLLPEGEMKREFLLNCASCHEIGHSRVLRDGKPRTSADWLDAIAMMRAIDVYGLTPPDFDDGPSTHGSPSTRYRRRRLCRTISPSVPTVACGSPRFTTTSSGRSIPPRARPNPTR